MHVKLFFRHRRPEYNSIEGVFDTILNSFPNEITYERVELPYSGAGFTAIIRNLIYAWRHRGAINHVTGDVHYIALATGKNTVLTLHDSQSAFGGSGLRNLIITWIWFRLPAWYARKITVISPSSKQELERIVPFAKSKIEIIPNPYNPLLRSIVSNHTVNNEPIILLMGTKSNKNLERTVEAISVLKSKLLIVGKLTPTQKNLLKAFRVSYENYFNISFSEIAELYRRCNLVCFASLYEGFGVPIVEAQRAGKPVVTSSREPMQWVAGDGACFVDPLDTFSIREGVSKILNDPIYRKDLIEKAKVNVARFDPSIVAGKYMAIYKAMMN